MTTTQTRTENTRLVAVLRSNGFTEARIREVLESEPGYQVRLLRKYEITAC